MRHKEGFMCKTNIYVFIFPIIMIILDELELEFYSPVNTIKVMLSQSVYLTTFFLGMHSPLSS